MDRKLVFWTSGVLALLAAGAVIYLWRLPEQTRPVEVPILAIPIAGGAETSEIELSGMAWWHDTLVLMPQYPQRHGHRVFAIERDRIERFIDEPTVGAPLTVRSVPIDTRNIEDEIVGFDGFEAIEFHGDVVYFSVEGDRDETEYAGFVVRGHVEGRLSRIVLEMDRVAPLEPQNELENTGYEALVVQGNRVLAIYETNGEVNERPRVMMLDEMVHRSGEVPMEPVEYRVTDATSVDSQGRFWVANYHWPGAPWQAGTCSLTERYGEGESHARCATVERLVELRITDQGVRLTHRAPVQLELIDDQHARNWEALVRLPGRGFLLATDEHPQTILAFVPYAD